MKQSEFKLQELQNRVMKSRVDQARIRKECTSFQNKMLYGLRVRHNVITYALAVLQSLGYCWENDPAFTYTIFLDEELERWKKLYTREELKSIIESDNIRFVREQLGRRRSVINDGCAFILIV